MRPFEVVLVVAVVGALVSLVFRRRGGAGWVRHVPLVALPAMGVQLVVEGWRWQMVPAYALGGVFGLIWLARVVRPVSAPAGRRWVGRLVAVVGACLGVVGLMVSVAVPLLFPVFGFPEPTGPYGIGTVTYHWTDAGRGEVFTADPADRRELLAQVWYPAVKGASAARAPWLPDAATLAPALTQTFHLPGLAFGHFRYVTTHATPSVPVAGGADGYPVLLFLSGFRGFRGHNTFQVEQLVSHGYVVVGIDQPYTAASVVFPDGRQVVGRSRDQLLSLIEASYAPADAAPTLNGQAYPDGLVPYLARDVSFTLDELAALNRADPNNILTGRLDLRRAGLFGVSLGGIVGPEACRTEPRLRACLMMDAPMPTDVVRDGLRQPSMWITRDADTMRLEGWPQIEIDQHQDSMRAVYRSLPGDGYFVRVPGAFHVNFTDYPLVSPLMPTLGVTGPIDARRAHAIVNAYTLAFFDHELNSQPETLLGGPPAQYPEVLFDTRRP